MHGGVRGELALSCGVVTPGDNWTPLSEFDGFAIRGPIGSGGMGRVFLAYEAALDRKVAIKFVTAAAPGRAARDRFLIEARAVARLSHPNVVSIFRIGEVSGRPYLASEYVEGTSLDRLTKPLAWARILEIASAIAGGLGAAHERGVLHRDIKPGNVIEALDGTVKLLDFGLAKLDVPTSEAAGSAPVMEDPGSPTPETANDLPWSVRSPDSSRVSVTMPIANAYELDSDAKTITGAVLGTPLFLAPELWAGYAATQRSDVYSTGVLLYELCAGDLPFSDLAGAPLVRHVREVGLPPLGGTRPDIPRTFAQIVDRCVSRVPEARFASAVELSEAVAAVVSVFRNFRTVAPGTPDDDAAIVAESFARVARRVDEFFAAVYEELFRVDPTLRALFPVDLTEQRGKLAVTFRLAVESLRNPERLVPVLEDLGRRHVGYGVATRQLRVLGAVLLTCLERFEGPAWSDRLRVAWEHAYGAMSSAMEQGMLSVRGAA
jgi:serine/threonine protein kinase/hemoglobin-like flavoprotein